MLDCFERGIVYDTEIVWIFVRGMKKKKISKMTKKDNVTSAVITEAALLSSQRINII